MHFKKLEEIRFMSHVKLQQKHTIKYAHVAFALLLRLSGPVPSPVAA